MLETQPQTPENVPATEPEAPLVTLSDAAVDKLTELTKEEADPNVGLRVYVYSGGCSGYRYGMMLEDQPSGEDVKVEANGINVYVDPQSVQLLRGSEIDYVDTTPGRDDPRLAPARERLEALALEIRAQGRSIPVIAMSGASNGASQSVRIRS